MSDLRHVTSRLEKDLDRLAAVRDVRAVAIAVSQHGAQSAHFAGHLSGNGAPVGADSVFEIGSVTKVWTATLIMQLIDEGQLQLDQAVRDVIPEFRSANSASSDLITFRHLLTHTAGFDGDNFTDTGEGDDCLAAYIEHLGDTPQYFAPGRVFSYNNVGFALLGRAIEKLRGMSYDEVLEQHLVKPLRLAHVYPNPFMVPDDQLVVGVSADGADVARGALPRSVAPAGTRLSMSVEDLLAFGRLFAGGARNEGMLSDEATRAMLVPQDVEVPDLANDWSPCRGLGWELTPSPQGTLVAHSGDTLGQHAILRVVPEADLVVAMIAVGGDAHGLQDDLIPGVVRELAHVTLPDVPALSEIHDRETTRAISGTYTGAAATITVRAEADGRVRMARQPLGDFAKIERPAVLTLKHLRDRTYLSYGADGQLRGSCAFGSESPRASYVHTGRAFPRSDHHEETR